MKGSFVLYIFFIGVHTLVGQSLEGYDWNDIRTKDHEATLHKITGEGNHLWGVDYGTGSIFHSPDLGQHWELQATLGSEYFERVQFLDTLTGFVCGDYGFVYKTNDGGKTWVDISPEVESRIMEWFRNDSTKNQEPEGYYMAYYSMHFYDEQSGYISGYQMEPKLGWGSMQRLFYNTTNGGKSWKSMAKEEQDLFLRQMEENCGAEHEVINDKYFLSKDEYWRLGRDGDKGGYIVHSDIQQSHSDTVFLQGIPFERYMLRSIVSFNSETAFILGGSLGQDEDRAVVFRTDDAGKSWNYQTSSWPHVHSAIRVGDHIVVSGKDGLLKHGSTDDFNVNQGNEAIDVVVEFELRLGELNRTRYQSIDEATRLFKNYADKLNRITLRDSLFMPYFEFYNSGRSSLLHEGDSLIDYYGFQRQGESEDEFLLPKPSNYMSENIIGYLSPPMKLFCNQQLKEFSDNRDLMSVCRNALFWEDFNTKYPEFFLHEMTAYHYGQWHMKNLMHGSVKVQVFDSEGYLTEEALETYEYILSNAPGTMTAESIQKYLTELRENDLIRKR